MANTTSIIPYIRSNEILFNGINLKPGKTAHFFFDGTLVDQFIQKASVITTNTSDVSFMFKTNEGLYCSNTKSYATVISTSSNNIIYLNDNYVSLNVTPYDGVTPFGSDDFKNGDIIFTSLNASSNIAANTYSARVQYFNSTDKVIVVKSLTGTVNTSSTIRSLYNLSNAKRANIANVLIPTERFPIANAVTSTSNSSNVIVVSTYTHNHGTISTLNASATVLNLMSAPPSDMLSNNAYITSGTGFPNSFRVDTVSGTTIANSSFSSSAITGISTYSLGSNIVDDYGNIAGIFQLPENSTYKFKTGQRLFTITDTLNIDDVDNQMKGVSEYVAGGLLQTVDKAIEKITPVVPPAPPAPPVNRFVRRDTFQGLRGDPLAQTFFTPNDENGNGLGLFISSIDLYFKNKPRSSVSDPELPVSVRIVKTQNGYPTQEVIAEVFVACKDVTTTNGTTTFPSTSDSTTATKFAFKDPVYLSPGEEYAIVVYSDSPSYEAWIAELGQTVIGDTNNRRISEQPYTGSFFRSQNASTWTPFQNQDLMFVINKAVFNTASSASMTFNVLPPLANIGIHNMTVHSSEIIFSNTSLNFNYRTTLATTGALENYYSPIEENKIFNFSSDLKTSTLNTNRKRVVLAGNANSLFIQMSFSTSDNNISPVVNRERLSLIAEEYYINDGSLANTNITVTNGGGQHTNVANLRITITAPQLYSDISTSTANATVLASDLVSGNITAITITNPGRGYIESPTITIADLSPGVTANATAVIVSEDGKGGGNALARYLTKKIILADGFDAGDMRVYVECIRPQGTHVIAYYKVLSESDPDSFDNKKWKRMYLTNDIISQDTITPVELVFQPSSIEGSLNYVENNITYPLGGTFKYFAIKLVMLTADPSVPPIIRNLRAIALPAG